MPEQVNDKKYGITINKKLVVAENEYEVKTRIPFTYGENERHLNFKKEDVKEIHNGKTLLTSLTDNKNYMIYDKNDKVVGNMLGKELYSLHYDRLPGLYSFPKEYTQDNVVKDEHIQEEHIQEEHIQEEQVQHEQQKNEQPQQKQTKQEAVQDEQVQNKPLSKRDTVSTDNEPYRPKITALANIYDSTNLKIAKQQDKIEILQSKNEKSNAKIQKATHFVDMCNVLLESKALPTPVLNLVDMLAENKKNKINTLEDKIKARNGKIAKANKKITKAEKKISSLRKIDSFINNLSSSEGRKDILVNGMVDFATYSKSNAEAKLENVNSKMAEVQALKDYTHFRADKIKYSNKLDKLSAKKEKLENKIKACENLFDKASTVVEKLNDIQTKMLCDNITTNVISTATTTPEQVSLDTVVDACNKSIAEMPVNERVSEEKNNPDNYLKNTEMAVEGNYDMIDGIINNEPPKREEKQESKQTFSLGINNLKKSAKRISEKKPENTNRDKAKGKDENSI